MLVLVTYDVATSDEGGSRRLRRVARACADYGVRVQKSVFECQIGAKEWVQLKTRLLQEGKFDKDSIRFYFLDSSAAEKTEHHGVAQPVDFSEPLIL